MDMPIPESIESARALDRAFYQIQGNESYTKNHFSFRFMLGGKGYGSTGIKLEYEQLWNSYSEEKQNQLITLYLKYRFLGDSNAE